MGVEYSVDGPKVNNSKNPRSLEGRSKKSWVIDGRGEILGQYEVPRDSEDASSKYGISQ